MKSDGMKICVTCGLCLRRLITFSTDDYHEDENRFFLKNTGPDKVKEIRDKMNELIEMVVREYTDDPPRESHDYTKELCDACYNYALPNNNVWKKIKHKSVIRCHIHSLCAAVLWEKVNLLYGDTDV